MDSNHHAYMIMAHHRFDILEEILKDIDDERNDIFLHVDSKAADFETGRYKKLIKRAHFVIVDRMDVHWGGFSQIQCVLMLLKIAVSFGYHSYYHFMVGVEFPLKTQNYIHKFFDTHSGYEFIGFDNYDNNYIERVKYYHIFNEYARNNTFFQKILNKIRIFIVIVQKCIHFDLTKKYKISFKKGNANWSITHELALYIISKEEEIKKIYKHSFCGDEVFIHTLVYNSKFWNNVYDKKDEYLSSMRIVNWENKNNRFCLDDLNILLDSGRLFARKIDGKDAIELIKKIMQNRK